MARARAARYARSLRLHFPRELAMVTSLVLLAATWASMLCPVQDTPRPDPAPADPAAPAATADAPPAQTSEKVRGFLMQAEGQLYDPPAAGLTSLAFALQLRV